MHLTGHLAPSQRSLLQGLVEREITDVTRKRNASEDEGMKRIHRTRIDQLRATWRALSTFEVE